MENILENITELMDFDFSKLEPKSNYFKILSNNFKIKNTQHLKKWRIINRPKQNITPILIEITPNWLTVSVYDGKYTRVNDFECSKENPKSILEKIFEM